VEARPCPDRVRDKRCCRDTVYVGAALADDIRQCDRLVDMMSFWTFDDVFEEGRVVKEHKWPRLGNRRKD
jgi:beta-xylosidase